MGNIQSNREDPYSLLFIESIENAFLTMTMVEEMMVKWSDLGKPLFMIPRDFKERILGQMSKQVRINYMKWLTRAQEIDIFELFCIFILYCRA